MSFTAGLIKWPWEPPELGEATMSVEARQCAEDIPVFLTHLPSTNIAIGNPELLEQRFGIVFASSRYGKPPRRVHSVILNPLFSGLGVSDRLSSFYFNHPIRCRDRISHRIDVGVITTNLFCLLAAEVDGNLQAMAFTNSLNSADDFVMLRLRWL